MKPRKPRLGRYPHFQRRFPEASLWLTAGLIPKSARALVEAGYRSLTDLEGVTREQLLALPGVGHFAVEVLEQLLGRPLPDAPASLPEAQVFPERVWRLRGLPPEAAITFAIEEMTLERLKAMTREELLSLSRVGPAAVWACGRLLGREIPSGRQTDPGEVYWRNLGIRPKAAQRLSQAGIRSVEELRNQTREFLLALRGIGETLLRQLEKIAGREIPSRSMYWRDLGLSKQLAHALLSHRINTREELETLTRRQFLRLSRLGYRDLRQCERLLERRLPSEPSDHPERGM